MAAVFGWAWRNLRPGLGKLPSVGMFCTITKDPYGRPDLNLQTDVFDIHGKQAKVVPRNPNLGKEKSSKGDK